MTIFYGEPRFTNDIDIVVDLPASAVTEFCRQFPAEGFWVSEDAAMEAVRRYAQFNIIEPRTGLKVDVIIPPPSDFNRARFSRARRVQAGDGWDAAFSSPEDAIVKKMKFFRAGGTDKHLRDIAGVLKTSGSEIDRVYIDRWATTFGLTEIWQAILESIRE